MTISLATQPTSIRSLSTTERNALITSTVKVDGSWIVVSRYGDDVWSLTGGTTNSSASYRRIDFTKVSKQFRDQFKAMVYRYMRRGRIGGIRPGPRQVNRFVSSANLFIRHLERMGISNFKSCTPLACANYVHERKAHRRRSGKLIGRDNLSSSFSTVEAIYELSQFTDDPMPSFPWPGETSYSLSGRARGMTGLIAGRTPLIPDDVFSSLFQAAWSEVQEADRLLTIRDRMDAIEQHMNGAAPFAILTARRRQVNGTGAGGDLIEFRRRIIDIRTACYIVIASLSGCRNHELANVHAGSFYRTEDDDGDSFWWMKSKSEKTDAGYTEWMIPESAVIALRVMERWVKPYQEQLTAEIEQLRSSNPRDPEIAEALKHDGALFLGVIPKVNNRVRTLSVSSWNVNLKAFAKRHGVNWTFTSHQFRRKFANYAARSQFGDLRYLKQHFKHWSFDMTLAYAMNEFQEVALYSEVYDELTDLKEGVVAQWMQPDTRLAGGLGNRVIEWRGSHNVTMFSDHASMVRTLADGFSSLRSNGHAWCTADQGIDCVGNGGLDRTRCSGCENAVIGPLHRSVYQGMYDHLRGVLDREDIGEAGTAYVRRSMARCSEVLRQLGHDVDLKASQ